MIPQQSLDLSMVKLEELSCAQQKTPLFPYNYPYFLPISTFSTHELYLAVKQQISEYERTHGIQIQPNCNCKHKSKKKMKKEDKEIRKFPSESFNNGLNSQMLKNETIEQKQGRNVNSNLLRMFFRRLEYKIQNQTELIQKIINKISAQISVQEFDEWVRGSKIDYRNYIRVPQVKHVFCSKEAHYQKSQVLRILFKQFLVDESHCCYLTSRKIKKDSMKLNLTVVRTICQELFGKTI